MMHVFGSLAENCPQHYLPSNHVAESEPYNPCVGKLQESFSQTCKNRSSGKILDFFFSTFKMTDFWVLS